VEFISIEDLIRRDGLRLVLVKGTPSPWGQAAKAMMEYKGLDFVVAPQLPGEANPELVAWAGTNSGPVVAWNDGPPLNRWDDILFLIDRLAPQRPLVPDDARLRTELLGLAHAICGELGLGWNRRLSLLQPAMQSGEPPAPIVAIGRKYRYNESDVALAPQRQIGMLRWLAEALTAQRRRGSAYFVGEGLTAVDFYWAAFSNLFDLLPPELCPVAPAFRPLWERIEPEVKAALDPILIEHRDRILKAHFRLPMEF
jgi:glutathione S-transferase